MKFIVCPFCKHRNKPHDSFRLAVRLILLDEIKPCRKCGVDLRPHIQLKETKTVKEIRQQLLQEGFNPVR